LPAETGCPERSDRARPSADPHVTEGDAKVWETVEDVKDDALHQRYAEALFEETGFDLRGRTNPDPDPESGPAVPGGPARAVIPPLGGGPRRRCE